MRGKKNKSVAGRSLVHFLIHWRGYDTEEDTWEPLANLTSAGVKKLLTAFNKAERENKRVEGRAGSSS